MVCVRSSAPSFLSFPTDPLKCLSCSSVHVLQKETGIGKEEAGLTQHRFYGQ